MKDWNMFEKVAAIVAVIIILGGIGYYVQKGIGGSSASIVGTKAYVADYGNDENDGSQDNPYRTIQVATESGAGEIVVLGLEYHFPRESFGPDRVNTVQLSDQRLVSLTSAVPRTALLPPDGENGLAVEYKMLGDSGFSGFAVKAISATFNIYGRAAVTNNQFFPMAQEGTGMRSSTEFSVFGNRLNTARIVNNSFYIPTIRYAHGVVLAGYGNIDFSRNDIFFEKLVRMQENREQFGVIVTALADSAHLIISGNSFRSIEAPPSNADASRNQGIVIQQAEADVLITDNTFVIPCLAIVEAKEKKLHQSSGQVTSARNYIVDWFKP